MEVEELFLEITRLAVDYVAVKKGIAPKTPISATQKEMNALIQEIKSLTDKINQIK